VNTLNNTKTYLQKEYYLDQGGDMWRVFKETKLAQASGPVKGSYNKVIPFCQQEFKNAFLE
jgi:hypothetical protein